MARPYYRFSIKTPDNKYYQFNQANQVVTDTTAYYLPNAPVEWAEVERKLERSKRHSGLFVKYAPDAYTFPLKGAEILRHIWATGGPRAEAYLYVDEFDSDTLTYGPYTSGKFDFNAYRDERFFVEIPVKQGGIVDMIEAKEDTDVEIPITTPDAINIRIPSLYLQGKARWVSVWPNDGNETTTAFDIIAMANVENVGVGDPITALSANYTNDHKLFNINRDLYNIHFKGHLNYYLDNNNGFAVDYELRFVNTPIGTFEVIQSGTVAANTDVNLQAEIDFTHPFLAAGTGVAFTLFFDSPGTMERVVHENNNPLEVTFLYHTNSFTCLALPLHRAGNKILKAITNNAATLNSSFLTGWDSSYANNYDNNPGWTVLVSGDAIRGVNTSPYSYPALKTNWAAFFKSMVCLYDVGMDITGNTVNIKPAKNYYNTGKQIIDLGQVKDAVFYNASEYQYNTLKIGYQPKEYDEINGRDEYNTTQLWGLPTDVKAELNLVNPYRGDMYGVFFAWAKYHLFDTSDSENDNDIFIIEVNPTATSGAHDALRLSGNISGLELNDPGAYNFGITPKRCFWRNRRSIYSGLFKCEGQNITYQRTDKNAALNSTFAGPTIDEDADVPVSSLGANANDRHYIPVGVEVTTSLPANIIETIQANSDGYIKFTWRGKSFKFFPDEIGETPSSPKEQVIKGRCLPDTDFTGM